MALPVHVPYPEGAGARRVFIVWALGVSLAWGFIATPSVAQQTDTGAEGLFHGVGVIVAIDPQRPAITLDHEDIKGLMPGMEMMFRIRSKSLLNGLKVGDKVRFDIQGKGYVIVGLSPAPD